MLQRIDAAYAARAAGDRAAVADHWEPGATYRLAGEATVTPALPGDAIQAVNALIDLFEFHELERVHAVVEGDSAAIHWRVRVSTPGGEPVEAEIYDLWRFAASGRVASLVQFTDTALIVRMLA